MCAADRSLAIWVINKFAVANVKTVGVAAGVIPADAAGFVCDAAVAAVSGSVESAVVIAVIIVHTTRVICKVVISAAVMSSLGYATVVVVPIFGVVASEFGATRVVCGVVLLIIAASNAEFVFASSVTVADTTHIVCGVAVLILIAAGGAASIVASSVIAIDASQIVRDVAVLIAIAVM